MEEVTADVVETAKEQELEVEPEDVIELLQSHDKTLMDELLLRMSTESGFLRCNLLLMKMLLKTAEMTTKDLKCYIHLVDKAVARFERIDFNFERSSTVHEIYQTALHATEKWLMEGTVNQYGKLHCWLILRNSNSHPNLHPTLNS